MDQGDQKTEHVGKQPRDDDPGQNERADQPSQEDQPGPKKKKKLPVLLFLRLVNPLNPYPKEADCTGVEKDWFHLLLEIERRFRAEERENREDRRTL
jgi:hypothetical protein